MTPAEIRERYTNEGMSRRQFGAHIGVPEGVLRRLESGLRISPENAKKVADHFGCKVTDLMPLEDVPA